MRLTSVVESRWEKDVEKRVCKAFWDAYNEFYDEVLTPRDRHDQKLLCDLKDALSEAVPYGPTEV